MSKQPERFGYPFTASTVLARKLIPLLLFTMGIGLFLLAGRQVHGWARPWAVLPAAALGLLCWLAAGYLFTLLPEVRAGDDGLRVRRWGLFWRRIPWESVAGVRVTARVDLLGWVESFYTVYRWRTVAGRRRVRREWHRKQVRAFRFSGHIRNCERLLARIEARSAGKEGKQMAVFEAVSDDTAQQQDGSPHNTPGRLGRGSWWRLGIALALFALALMVYVLTLAPGLLGGDAGEFQTAARVWGLSHPTGYPLYMVLLKVWALLPIGSVAYRANLLAAVLAAATTGLFFVLLQMISRETLAAVVGALVLAFSPLFWSQAVIADKYALNTLLIAGVLAAALFWGQAPGRRRLYLLALAYGLSLAHHRTMILLAPGLAIYVLWMDRGVWRARRNWLALLCLALPLVLYIYLPLTRAFGRPLSNWWPSSLAEWLAYLTAQGHLGETQTAVAPLAERLAFYGRTLVDQFTWWGLLLSLAGWLWLLRRQRPLFALLLVSLLLEAATSMAYYADPRNQAFFLPSFLIVALTLGLGAGALLQWVAGRLSRWPTARPALLAVLGLALCLLPATLLLRTYPEIRARQRQDHALDVWRQDLQQGQQARRLAELGLAQVAPNAIIVGDWEQATPLRYSQWVEGLRPDVEVVYPVLRLEEMAASGRPLYIARNHPGLADRWHPSADGPLIALRSEPTSDLPDGAVPLGIRMGDAFELAGFAAGGTGYGPGSVMPLTIFWRALSAPAHDYSVSLRLFDSAGQEVFKQDNQHPALGTYPTSRWAAGEVVGGYYEIQLSPDLAPGIYQWGVILYRTLPEGGWENVKVAGGEGEVAMGGTIQVEGQ